MDKATHSYRLQSKQSAINMQTQLAPLLPPPPPNSVLRPTTPKLPRPISAGPSSFSSRLPHRTGTVIVGGGLAGLAAATHLHSANIPFLLLEASDGVGGRVRTDVHDGFLLDRGFQIFLTAYPEAKKLLDYAALDLQPFYPGALVYHGGSFHRVADPARRPLDGILSLANPIGSVADKIRIGLVRVQTMVRSDEEIFTAQETSIMGRLRQYGFSGSIVDRFFRPFFGGIFFDRELETTSRLFDFVFKILALGDNALPARGIEAIPRQLAANLPASSIRLNAKVVSVDVENQAVVLAGGETIGSEMGVIVAVEQPEATKLLPEALSSNPAKPSRGTACLYFSADRAPVEDPILILNGSGKGMVNNMFFATNVAPSYGPKGKVLVSVSVVGAWEGTSDDRLREEVVRELKGWFGDGEVGSWKHLRTYRVGFAQPNQTPPTELARRDPRVRRGIYLCGDHWSSATFDGALVSGRRAAEALVEDRMISTTS